MIIPVRRFVATCALGALGVALAACGTPGTPHAARPGHPASASGSTDAQPSRPPTLAPGSSGTTPVFTNGPRTQDKTVALTFDADMTADEGPRAAAGEHFDNPELIATLRAFKVPATLFMTGRWADEYPKEARAIGQDPLFEVANHSYSHYAFTDNCYGLPTVPQERMRAEVEEAYAAFKKAGVPHAMPYFRFPGGCYDQQALRTIVPELRKKGFRFVKVSEMIGSATQGERHGTT